MLTITFTVEDLARTRLAVSPLWETVASIRLLKTPRAQTFHQEWARTTKDRIARAGVELELLFDLIDPGVWYLADFLTPPPQSAVPDLATDLSAMRRVPAEQVRADLDVLGYARTHPIGSLEEASVPRRLRSARAEDLPTEAVADLYADPDAGMSRLADQVEAYWELAMAPHWDGSARCSKEMCSTAGGGWDRQVPQGCSRISRSPSDGATGLCTSSIAGSREYGSSRARGC